MERETKNIERETKKQYGLYKSNRYNSKSSPENIRKLENQKEIVRLRKDGESFESISEKLDIPKSQVQYLMMQVIRQLNRENVEEYRDYCNGVLIKALCSLDDKMSDGDEKAALVASKIVGQMAALNGLNKAKEVTISHISKPQDVFKLSLNKTIIDITPESDEETNEQENIKQSKQDDKAIDELVLNSTYEYDSIERRIDSYLDVKGD